MNKPTIVSITYSIKLSYEIIKKIFTSDYRGHGSLRKRLMKRNEVKDVRYQDWLKEPGDKLGDSIKITVFSDSVSNPDKNQKYWEGVADEISDHIWGVK